MPSTSSIPSEARMKCHERSARGEGEPEAPYRPALRRDVTWHQCHDIQSTHTTHHSRTKQVITQLPPVPATLGPAATPVPPLHCSENNKDDGFQPPTSKTRVPQLNLRCGSAKLPPALHALSNPRVTTIAPSPSAHDAALLPKAMALLRHGLRRQGLRRRRAAARRVAACAVVVAGRLRVSCGDA